MTMRLVKHFFINNGHFICDYYISILKHGNFFVYLQAFSVRLILLIYSVFFREILFDSRKNKVNIKNIKNLFTNLIFLNNE